MHPASPWIFYFFPVLDLNTEAAAMIYTTYVYKFLL